MRRRVFIAALGGATLWPCVAIAQQRAPLVAFLNRQSPDAFAAYVNAFRDEGAYVEGQNVAVVYRWARGRNDALPALAAELAALRPVLIVTSGGERRLSRPSVVERPELIVSAIDAAKRDGAQGLNVLASPLLHSRRLDIFERTASLRLPAIYQAPEFAEEGGLLGYGPRLTHWFRQLARQVAKVLRGEKPADIPVQQPTHFELMVNLRTAKAIGYEIPAGLALRADKVIE
jgi:ABC-type uncharacterized transport system substrate-binding protein